MGLAHLMGADMTDYLLFIAKIGTELYDLYRHVKSGQLDPEAEKQLAMRIVRKAIDEEARKEIEGV